MWSFTSHHSIPLFVDFEFLREVNFFKSSQWENFLLFVSPTSLGICPLYWSTLCFGARMVTLKHEIESLSSFLTRACTHFISDESKATDVSSLMFFALGVASLWGRGWPLAKIWTAFVGWHLRRLVSNLVVSGQSSTRGLRACSWTFYVYALMRNVLLFFRI